jgi:gluconate kinase
MVKLLFVFGCSGSGKSTISHRVVKFAQASGWDALAINDYPILYEMFQADRKREKFDHADMVLGGFDVRDTSVYDTALDELNRQVRTITERVKENALVIIEFARCDYREALKHFDDCFLHAAQFLFLDADIKTCKQRVLERIAQPQSLDDHFVPDDVIECLGQASCKHYIESELKLDYGISNDRVRILDTGGAIEEVILHVEQFLDTILPIPVPAGS